MPEFDEALERVVAGPERKSRIISDEEKAIIAYHEGGHALVQRILPKCDPVAKVSIISRGMALGYTMGLPTEDRYLQSKSEFEDKIAGMLGGNVAERLMFGDTTTGSSNDIEKATKLARRMVTEFGMSDKLGPRAFGKREEIGLPGPRDRRAAQLLGRRGAHDRRRGARHHRQGLRCAPRTCSRPTRTASPSWRRRWWPRRPSKATSSRPCSRTCLNRATSRAARRPQARHAAVRRPQGGPGGRREPKRTPPAAPRSTRPDAAARLTGCPADATDTGEGSHDAHRGCRGLPGGGAPPSASRSSWSSCASPPSGC